MQFGFFISLLAIFLTMRPCLDLKGTLSSESRSSAMRMWFSNLSASYSGSASKELGLFYINWTIS